MNANRPRFAAFPDVEFDCRCDRVHDTRCGVNGLTGCGMAPHQVMLSTLTVAAVMRPRMAQATAAAVEADTRRSASNCWPVALGGERPRQTPGRAGCCGNRRYRPAAVEIGNRDRVAHHEHSIRR